MKSAAKPTRPKFVDSYQLRLQLAAEPPRRKMAVEPLGLGRFSGGDLESKGANAQQGIVIKKALEARIPNIGAV